MDRKRKELLDNNRSQFLQIVEAERLLPYLRDVLTESEHINIKNRPTQIARVDKLLEVLPLKPQGAFDEFCNALHTTYPTLWKSMFDEKGSKDTFPSKPKPVYRSQESEDQLHPPVVSTRYRPVSIHGHEQILHDRRQESVEKQHRQSSHQKMETYIIGMSRGEGDKHLHGSGAHTLDAKLDTYMRQEVKMETHFRKETHMKIGNGRKNVNSPDLPMYGSLNTQKMHSPHMQIDPHIRPLQTSELPKKRLSSSVMPKKSSNETEALDSPSSKPSNTDYESLQTKCDMFNNELHEMRKEQTENARKCEQAVKEADQWKNMYVSVKNKNESLTQDIRIVTAQFSELQNKEIHILKETCAELLGDKERLQHEVHDMKKKLDEGQREINELKKQQREVLSESGSSEVLNMYDSTVDKYESLKNEHDEMRKQYSDNVAHLSQTKVKVEQTQEENNRLRMRIDEMGQLHRHLTSTVQAMDRAKDEVQDELKNVQLEVKTAIREKEDYRLKMQFALEEQISKTKKLGQFEAERDAAIREYSLIMSERNLVHKEMETLEENMSATQKKLESVMKDKKDLDKQNDSIRRQLIEYRDERDCLGKQVKELKDKYRSVSESIALEQKKDGIIRDFDELLEKEMSRMERQNSVDFKSSNKELSLKEIENLKKENEKLRSELSETQQEMESANRTRDWVFSEREKIVGERESIRALCDKLRHERDNAVSRFMEAVKDSDELKKLKNEAVKDYKDLKEKYDVLVEKETRKNQLNAVGNQSRDSAIDADISDWETETLQFDIGSVDPNNLGFEMTCGGDGDSHVYVSSIQPGTSASNHLRVYDQIMRINGVDVTNVDKNTALQAARSKGSVIKMVIKRRKLTRAVTHSVHLNLSGERDAGICVEEGIYVSRILNGSAAAKEGTLAVGDRVLTLNGQSIDQLTLSDINRMIRESTRYVSCQVVKYCSVSSTNNIVSRFSSGASNFHFSEDRTSVCSPDSAHHSQMWENVKAGANSLKSSGSQTDSLDSPDPRSSVDTETASQTAHIRTLDHREQGRKPLERHRPVKNVDKSRYDNREKPALFNRAMDIISRPFQNRDRAERDARSKSGLPAVFSQRDPDNESDDNVDIDDVNIDISRHDPRKSHQRDNVENAGTWPKCRSFQEYPEQLNFPTGSRKKERAPIPGDTFYCDNQRPPPMDKLPPTPPERSDSFKRSASVKRSPQNSDSMKYLQKTKPISPYQTSPPKQSNINSAPMRKPQVPQPMEAPNKSYSKTRNDSTPNNSESAYDNSVHHNSNTDSIVPDYTVVSGHNRMRPNSAPSRKRAERRELSNQVHGGNEAYQQRQQQPRKPSNLDVQPVYSARPGTYPVHSLSSDGSTTTSPVPPLFESATPRDRAYAPTPPQVLPFSPNSSSPTPGSVPPMSPGLMFPGVQSQIMKAHNHPGPISSIPPVSLSPRYSITVNHFPHRTVDIRNSSVSDMDSERSSSKSNLDYSTTSEGDFTNNIIQHYGPRHRGDHPMMHEGFSTFPKQHLARHHPHGNYSSQSVVSSRSSVSKMSNTSSSIDRVSLSDRGSPVPPYPLDPGHGGSTSSTPIEFNIPIRKSRPTDGETREIKIEKSNLALGIKIMESRSRLGIFVSSVGNNSLASRHGIEVGDQLLEVCGINMRNASWDHAANVLRQCSGSIIMLVQYNPKKCEEVLKGDSSDSSPSNSPDLDSPFNRGVNNRQSNDTITPDTISPQTLSPTSLSPIHGSHPGSISKSEERESFGQSGDTRLVILKKRTDDSHVNFKLTGGNLVGIFIDHITPNSVESGPKGLRVGDQILEYNSINFRNVTLEQATIEVDRPTETVTILAQHNVTKYTKIRDQPGDAFYVRVLYDRQANNDDEISFLANDVLFVDNTMYQGHLGIWRVWLVNDQGNKLNWGTLPIRRSTRLEEFVIKRSLSEIGDDDLRNSKRGSTNARRSFFSKKKQRHQRNSSKDSRELSSFSDVSLNSDSVPFMLDDGNPPLYERVERLDNSVVRPVLILGPFAEPLINKLMAESPDVFCDCKPETVKATLSSLETGQHDGMFVDFKARSAGTFECITVQSVKEIMDRNCHCLLCCDPVAIERLHKVQIYPIVLFIKHKTYKQIRDLKEPQFMIEKFSKERSKEVFDLFSDIEMKYKRLISDYIPGGNLASMIYKIKSAIEIEQKKTIWVPIGTL